MRRLSRNLVCSNSILKASSGIVKGEATRKVKFPGLITSLSPVSRLKFGKI